MATIKGTREAIKALPGMTAVCNDGEWRVTVNLYRLSERYPDKDRRWCEQKQEEMAYYTDYADDALSTARDMSRRWEQGAEAAAEAAQERAAVSRFMSVSVESTGNAAFADTGREVEVGRILRDAADKMESTWDVALGQRNTLRDLNGNKVGYLQFTDKLPALAEGDFWLSVRCSTEAPDFGREAAQHLRGAAAQVEQGLGEFRVLDANGNDVGHGRLVEPPSLERDGVIDMKAALSEGRVYLAEGGFSGLAEGEYRYVVVTDGFEPGYGQREGDAWLVNARGEVAAGYEEPQTVREDAFTELKRDQRDALEKVAQGLMSFEEHEQPYQGADDALEPS